MCFKDTAILDLKRMWDKDITWRTNGPVDPLLLVPLMQDCVCLKYNKIRYNKTQISEKPNNINPTVVRTVKVVLKCLKKTEHQTQPPR